MEPESIKRLRECARKLNSLGLVQLADQIVRWIDFVTGKNRSVATVEMFNQQTPAQLAQDIAKAEASSIESAAVMSAIITAAATVESAGYSGSKAILNIIESATGISVDDKQDDPTPDPVPPYDVFKKREEVLMLRPKEPTPPQDPEDPDAKAEYDTLMSAYDRKVGTEWDAYREAVGEFNDKVDEWNAEHPDNLAERIEIR